MKKFFASFLLTNMLGVSAGSFVGVCSGEEVCHNCSRVLSDEKKEKKEKKENGGGVLSRVGGSAMNFGWGVVDKVATTCITVDILANGKESFVGQCYSKVKGYADDAWNTAKKCGKATVDCAKTKVAEYTREREDWKITFGYCSGNKDKVGLSSVAVEAFCNCYGCLKQAVGSIVDWFSAFLSEDSVEALELSQANNKSVHLMSLVKKKSEAFPSSNVKFKLVPVSEAGK